MAQRNECANLEIENRSAYYDGKDHSLEDLMNLQHDIQTKVYGYDFVEMRKRMGDLNAFFQMNNLAINDEQMEQLEALGGVESYGNAIWKPWKKDHVKANERSYDDLTETEKLELEFECVDELHFVFNKMIALGITADRLYDLYYSKNKENIDRQKRGY